MSNWKQLAIFLVLIMLRFSHSFYQSGTSGFLLNAKSSNLTSNPNKANDTCPKECTCSTFMKTIWCDRRKLHSIPSGIPKSATVLYLGHNVISKVKKDDLLGLNNLIELGLNNNQISVIEPGAFKDLTSLKTLYMTNNKMTEIKEDVLKDISSIEKLYLTKNGLTEIPDFASIPLKNLYLLVLDTNNFSRADICKTHIKGIVFDKLDALILSNNRITSIAAKDFACINPKSFHKIDLSRCQLTSITKDAFSNFSILQSVYVSYNKDFTWTLLKNLTYSIGQSNGLSNLDFSGVFINKELPLNASTFEELAGRPVQTIAIQNIAELSTIEYGTFSHFPNLKLLDLSKGNLEELKDTFENNTKLKDLRLSKNKLTLSSIKLWKISNLENLDLTECNLGDLTDPAFVGLPNLKTLLLKKCEIGRIYTNTFEGLPNLEKVDLSMNKIGGSNLPSKLFSGSPKLKTIDLSSNKMTTIPTQYTLFKGLYMLTNLSLKDNDCSNISKDIFTDQNNLENLDLSGNNLGMYFSSTDGSVLLFNSLKNLIGLKLNKNKIGIIPNGLFNNLTSLKSLDLSDNLLSSLKASNYKQAQNLSSLILVKNKLSTLSPEDITDLPPMAKVSMSNNPFDCSCDLLQFGYWLRSCNESYIKLKLVDISECNCSSPAYMKGKPLQVFDPKSINAQCHWYVILILSLTTLLIIVLIVGSLVYYNWWNIRLHWYLLKRKIRKLKGNNVKKRKGERLLGERSHHGYGSIPTEDTDEDEVQSYDIHVCYAECDRDWVLETFIPKLVQLKKSKELTNGLTVNADIDETVYALGYNSSLNRPSFEEINDAFYKSLSILICISSQSLNNARHNSEIEGAICSLHERDVELNDGHLFLVFIESGIDVKLKNFLRPLVAHNHSFQWSEEKAKQELFWFDLCRAVKIAEPA